MLDNTSDKLFASHFFQPIEKLLFSTKRKINENNTQKWLEFAQPRRRAAVFYFYYETGEYIQSDLFTWLRLALHCVAGARSELHRRARHFLHRRLPSKHKRLKYSQLVILTLSAYCVILFSFSTFIYISQPIRAQHRHWSLAIAMRSNCVE